MAGYGATRQIQVGLDSSCALLFSRMQEPPTPKRKVLCSNLIKALKGYGIWNKLDALFITAAHAAQPARLNWIDPSQLATIAGTTTFTADQGYAGNGVDGTLNCGFALTALANYAQDSATLGCWSRTDTDSTGEDFGTTVAFLIGRTSGNLQARANAAAGDTTVTANSTGFYGFSRRSSSAYDIWKNGAVLSSPSRASSAIGGGNVRIGSGGGATFSTRQIAAGVVGAGLTATEIANLYTAVSTYMTAVGAA